MIFWVAPTGRGWVPDNGRWNLGWTKLLKTSKTLCSNQPCLNIQFLDLWRKKKASSGTSGRVAWASYHDDDPRDFGPGVAYTSRDSWPLAIIWMPCSEGGSCRPLNHMRQSHSKSRSKSPAYPYFWIRMIYTWRFSHWVILVVRIY